jgi:hypothetical protein
VRNREPDRRYAISSPTSAEDRKLDRRFAYANPTLVQRRQADADLQPTITTFYRRWFDVTLQTGILSICILVHLWCLFLSKD